MSNDVYRVKVPEDFKEFTYAMEDVRKLKLMPTDFDDDDYEVALFQLPLELDVHHLHNRKISLQGQSTCECGDDADVINVAARSSISDEIKTLLLLIPDLNTGNLISTAAKFKKYVVMTKSIVAPKIEYPAIDDSKVPFPEDLRVRYEPFGADAPALILSTKRKSSKRSQKPIQELTPIKAEKRKREKDGDDDATDTPKNKKQKKDGKEMKIKSEACDSDNSNHGRRKFKRELEAMEEPAMESPRKKKKHNKPEIKQEPLSSDCESEKRKRKHKEVKIKQEPVFSESESEKRGKKKKKKH